MQYANIADRAVIEKDVPRDQIPLPPTTWRLLARAAERFPQRRALSFQLLSGHRTKTKTLNYLQFQAQAAQAANLFRRLGVDESDVVACLLPNCNEFAVTYFGAQAAGIISPINPLLDAEQIASILRETGAKVVVTLKAFPETDVAQKTAEALRLAPNVETVLEVDFAHYLSFFKRLVIPFVRPKVPAHHQAKVLDFALELSKESETLNFAEKGEDRVASYFHTGGTTGMPKLAQHRFSGILYNAWIGPHILFTERDVLMCPLPLFHVFGSVVALGMSVAAGAELVLPTPAGYRGKGVFDHFWKLVERYRVTFMLTVPTAISALMQRPVDADISTLRLAISGSAPLPVDLYKRFEKTANLTICEGFGMTEATCLVAVNPPNGPKKSGSVGFTVPHTSVRIIDPVTQMVCAIDEVGEICVAGPGVFEGQTYTDAAKNAELFYPGNDGKPQWFRSGDLGRMDSEGYIFITGRAKDLIIRGGHNIDPAEIETALASHPAVAFTGAVGQPDAYAGELPCAYVELVKDADVSVEELLAHCKATIRERAAIPKYIEIMDDLPKTAVGKVFKPSLRKLAIERVVNRALREGGFNASVERVEENRKRGLVTVIRRQGDVDEEALRETMGKFTLQWDLK